MRDKTTVIIDTCKIFDGQIAQTSPIVSSERAEGVPRPKAWVVPCTGFDYGSSPPLTGIGSCHGYMRYVVHPNESDVVSNVASVFVCMRVSACVLL